ncbi:MAG: glucose-6-phosphate isomerase, partial [Myxococcota bacterium]
MTEARVTLDLSLALAPRVGGGVPEASLRAHPRTAVAVPAVLAAVEKDQLGFWTLPDDTALAARVRELAAQLRERFDRLVILGSGGSSLGGRMLLEALAAEPGRVLLVDNVDPVRFERTLASLDLERTAFNVISKSGGTVETAAQFVVLRDRLRRAFGDEGYRARVIATTDDAKGLMREIADADGLRTLPIPDNVGGRFSVLTAVGLLPAAYAGIDLEQLQAGARSMRSRCTSSDLSLNLALAHAALHHLADTTLRRPIHVVMPYCDRLRPFGEWYCQLWGESLGKARTRDGKRVHLGPTPVVAVGSTDQHSQIQLYVEGPEDKVVTFLRLEEPEELVPFPAEAPAGYAYLQGHTMA